MVGELALLRALDRGYQVADSKSVTQNLEPHDFSPSDEFIAPNRGEHLESIVGVSNLLSIAWLSRGLELSSAVPRILVNGDPDKVGSSLMVGDDLLLTNHHVLPDEATALASQVQFNYQLAWTGELATTRSFAISKFERTNADLDYTLVRVANSPGRIFGFIDPSNSADVAVNDFVVIVQYPGGGPKQIALMDNKVSAVFGSKLQYTTDTEPGSSGSPIFNTHWQVVGLHHAGGLLAGPDGTLTFTNEGVRFSLLVADAEGLLGDPDPLYALVFGSLQSAFVRLVEVGPEAADATATARALLAADPNLGDELLSRIAMRSNGQSAGIVIAVTGVALGAALVAWVRAGSGANFGPAAKLLVQPSEELIPLLQAVVRNGQLVPSAVYHAAMVQVLDQPSSVENLAAMIPDEPDVIAATTGLIISVLAGAQAVAP
jgi:V8-like Glu-specific endopeptidase